MRVFAALPGHRRVVAGLTAGLSACGLLLAAPSGERFPDPRPATWPEAVAALAEGRTEAECLTARVQRIRRGESAGDTTLRHALALLLQPGPATESRKLDEGLTVRFSSLAVPAGQAPPAAALEAVRLGVEQARQLFARRLALEVPAQVEVVLLDLDGGGPGYLLATDARSRQAVLAVDATPTAEDLGTRSAVIHQYAHAVADLAGPQFPVGWGEALATWAPMAIDGAPDATTAAIVSRRLAQLDAGLFSTQPAYAAGDAAWFSFLDEAYGEQAVRATIEALAHEPVARSAFDRALRESTGEGLAAAFREFQLWALLSGERADEFHFSYASQLASPVFASTALGLPALSVRSDPAVAAWGAAQVRIHPDGARGGIRAHFEGEFPGRWQADLLLIGQDGTKRRVSLDVSPGGRGNITVPADSVEEAILLVRNLSGEEVPPRRYTYALEVDRDYPFDIVSLEALPATDGVALAWETASEQDLVGFNVLRTPERGGSAVAVNPVWVPALGERAASTAYHFLDSTAEPGVSYVYRIQGITRRGLTRLSDPVVAGR